MCRRCVRVRRSLQPGVRDADGGTKHGIVRGRREVRRVLRDPVRGRPAMVRGRPALGGRDRHQLLPAQLGPAHRQWRVVQPSEAPLRHGPARIPQDRTLPRGHCPRSLPPVRFFSTTNYHYFYHYFYLPLTTSTSTSTSTSFHSSRLKKCH